MKLFKLFSMIGTMALVAACGSSQPSTNTFGNTFNPYGTGGYPQNNPYGYSSLLIGGQKQVQGTSVQVSVNVNAGDRLTVNLSNLRYTAGQAFCDGSVMDMNLSGFGGTQTLSNVTVTLNGQAVTGSFQASQAGVLTLSATLNPISINCGFLYNNRPATISYYIVDLGYAVVRN